MDIAHNRKAFHNYEILDKYEAGLVLQGMEVKSLRAHKVDMKDAYALVTNGEILLLNLYIAPYAFDGRHEVVPTRTRKLLLNKQEIKKIAGKTQQKGFTLIPLKMYFSERNLAKIQIGVAKAKKLIDKREDKKKKDLDRELQREMSARG